MADVQGTSENPILGFPMVVVRVNVARFEVTVIEHCRTFDQAVAAVDEYTTDGTAGEYLIVPAKNLRAVLAAQRRIVAKHMERTLHAGD